MISLICICFQALIICWLLLKKNKLSEPLLKEIKLLHNEKSNLTRELVAKNKILAEFQRKVLISEALVSDLLEKIEVLESKRIPEPVIVTKKANNLTKWLKKRK